MQRSGILDTFDGLPTHPLVVHFAVGLVLLAALTGVVAVAWPRRRPFLVPSAAVVSVLAAVSCLLATESGESLEDRVGGSGLVEQHAELGEQTRTIAIVLAVLTVVWWLVERRRVRGASVAVPARERRAAVTHDALVRGRSAGYPHTPTDADLPDDSAGRLSRATEPDD